MSLGQGALGSTTTNRHLIQVDDDAARRAKFNANHDATEDQQGSITYIFESK